MNERVLAGGCQCGRTRYELDRLGRASICHCRMCQRAFGNAFAPLVTALGSGAADTSALQRDIASLRQTVEKQQAAIEALQRHG